MSAVDDLFPWWLASLAKIDATIKPGDSMRRRVPVDPFTRFLRSRPVNVWTCDLGGSGWCFFGFGHLAKPPHTRAVDTELAWVLTVFGSCADAMENFLKNSAVARE